MKNNRQIDKIIESHTPGIVSGEETIESVLDEYPGQAGELRPMLEAILWLRNAKIDITPRPNFIISTRKNLEAQIRLLEPTNFWHRLFRIHTPERWVFNIAAPIILILMIGLVLNSLYLSAQLSLPGDAFYSTKLLSEKVRLAFAFDQVAKTNLYIQYSQERTTEFINLMLEGNYDTLPTAARRLETEIIAALHSINDYATQAPDNQQLISGKLKETLSTEIVMLNTLKIAASSMAYPEINLAIQAAQNGLMALR